MIAAQCLFFSLLLCLVPHPGQLPGGQAKQTQPKPITLWPDGAAGALGKEPADTPELSIYLPPAEKATGAAIVICPGGGYGGLAMNHEGHDVARWLNSIGVAGIILKYRHAPRYRHPAPLQDAQRAIRTVRSKAKEWGIDPNKVGILGFSAGGHLASTAATHFDAGDKDAKDEIGRLSSRPDFAVLVYPVITLTGPFAHNGSRNNLLGKNPDAKLVESLCNEKQVTAQTPPTFLVHTTEDKGVPPENSILFYQALRKAKVPCELHIFEQGRHGLGLGSNPQAKLLLLKQETALRELHFLQGELLQIEARMRKVQLEAPPQPAPDKKGKDIAVPDWLVEEHLQKDPVVRQFADKIVYHENQRALVRDRAVNPEMVPAYKELTEAITAFKKAQVARLEELRPKVIEKLRAAPYQPLDRTAFMAKLHEVLSNEIKDRIERINQIQKQIEIAPAFSAWPQLCEAWLKARKITAK